MKLISLNVALFEPNNKKLSSFLREQKADIVCFQEVTRGLDQLALKKYISKNSIDSASSQLKYSFFGPTEMMRSFEEKGFHKQDNFLFDPGGLLEIGNYLKSKYRILKAKNIFLQGYYSYHSDISSRAALIIDMKISQKLLRVINYHGIWTKDKQGNRSTLNACKKINELALKALGEVIICGDFNLFPDTESMQVFKGRFLSLVDTHKIKATRPSSNELSGLERNVVDYILVSKNLKVKGFNVIDTDVSDHLPLILEFDFVK